MPIDPFKFSETLVKSSFNRYQQSLLITSTGANKSSNLIILLRLMSGGVKFRSINDSNYIRQDIDYLDLNNQFTAVSPLKKMTSYLAPALTVDELGRLFSDRRFVNSNYEFHKRLLNEFANFLYFQKKESYITAFIYIYRVLEMISIPFPLIYASKIEDFNSAFQFLKACTSDELTKENSKGELGVFRVFLRKLFENDPMKDLNINISIDPNFPNEVQKTYYKVLERMCGDILDKSNCQEFDTLSVKFIELNTLIINIRNRFFHLFSANRHNIQSDEIPNTDQFFKLINNHLASWIALIYFEVVKFSISKR